MCLLVLNLLVGGILTSYYKKQFQFLGNNLILIEYYTMRIYIGDSVLDPYVSPRGEFLGNCLCARATA